MTPDHYDIVVAGGGIVGLFFAHQCIQTTDLKVLVIEPQTPLLMWDSASFGERVSAITPASQRLFNDTGVWAFMACEGVAPYAHMHVWDGESHGALRFTAASAGMEVLGHIVENRVMHKVLWQALAPYVQKASIINRQYTKEGWALTLQDGRVVHAALLVAADGACSPTRTALGIACDTHDYGHTAMIATLACEKPHDFVARQRFERTGPLAVLPLKHSHRCSIVWSQTPDEAARLQALSEPLFNQEITHRFEGVLGGMQLISERVVFVLKRQHARQYIQERAAFIGDAAHTVHPLAGQGLNMGLQDAAELSLAILKAKQQGRDFYARDVLRRYERAARARTLPVLALMEGFQKLFASLNPYVLHARSQGLTLLDRCPPLAALFIPR